MSTTRLIGVALLLTVGATCQVNAFTFYPQNPERQTFIGAPFVGRPDSNNQAEALIGTDAEIQGIICDATANLGQWANAQAVQL